MTEMKYTILTRQITAWMLMSLFIAEPAAIFATDAPISSDSKAPAAHQPLVQQTSNGIPLVQITAPTASGVSRNLYTDFNVPEKGAVLNNAHKVTNTQLAGYVQANPNLGRGTAKLIVNEVTGPESLLPIRTVSLSMEADSSIHRGLCSRRGDRGMQKMATLLRFRWRMAPSR